MIYKKKQEQIDGEKIKIERIGEIQDTLEVELSFYSDDELLGKILRDGLHDNFTVWSDQLHIFWNQYMDTSDVWEKEHFLEKLHTFLERSLENIARLADDIWSMPEIQRRELYRIYFESHLMMLEEVLYYSPEIDQNGTIQKIIDTYKDNFSGAPVQEIYERVNYFFELNNNAKVVRIGDDIYFYDRGNSLRYEHLLSLDEYEKIFVSRVYPDGSFVLEAIWSWNQKDVFLKIAWQGKLVSIPDVPIYYINSETYWAKSRTSDTSTFEWKLNGREIGTEIFSEFSRITGIRYVGPGTYVVMWEKDTWFCLQWEVWGNDFFLDDLEKGRHLSFRPDDWHMNILK